MKNIDVAYKKKRDKYGCDCMFPCSKMHFHLKQECTVINQTVHTPIKCTEFLFNICQ